MSEQRAAPRFKHRAPVGWAGGGVEGRGFSADISSSGVRVAETSAPVVNGARIQLVFGILDAPLTLLSEVVRQTGDGFAARFVESSFPGSLLRALQQLQSSGGTDPEPEDRE